MNPHISLTIPPPTPMRRAPCSFNSLATEIFHMIFSDLHANDLLNRDRTSKSLHKLSTPHFWSTIVILSSVQLERFQSPEAQLAFVRNAHLVCDLYLDNSLANIFLPKVACPHHTLLASLLVPHHQSPQRRQHLQMAISLCCVRA